MVEELKKAESFIFMEYFIIAPGVMWDTILDILIDKVKQGVEVRVMYDDAGRHNAATGLLSDAEKAWNSGEGIQSDRRGLPCR